VKKDTVRGIKGKTQGVSNAISPPKKPNPKTIQKLDVLELPSSELSFNNSLFFKSNFKALVILRLLSSIFCT
jgi:hypothetical protein